MRRQGDLLIRRKAGDGHDLFVPFWLMLSVLRVPKAIFLSTELMFYETVKEDALQPCLRSPPRNLKPLDFTPTPTLVTLTYRFK
jgi:hypothetical protein